MATRSLTRRGETFPAMFDDFFKPFNEWFDSGSSWRRVMEVPAVNITEDDNGYAVSLAAPGLKKDDFQINIDGDMITISSEKEEKSEETKEKYTRKEYNYSSFSRSFNLPPDVDREKIQANYADGILRLTLPFMAQVKKHDIPKKIQVS